MNPIQHSNDRSTPSRRSILKTSAAAGVVAATPPLFVPRYVHAAGATGTLKVGLVGCGGRGRGRRGRH